VVWGKGSGLLVVVWGTTEGEGVWKRGGKGLQKLERNLEIGILIYNFNWKVFKYGGFIK
jgi:hypothetical protein